MTFDGRPETPVKIGVRLCIRVRGNYERDFFIQQQ